MPEASMVRDLVHAVIFKNAVELLTDLVQQIHVQLVVQKAVDLQYVAGTDLPILQMRSSKSSFICECAPFTVRFCGKV